jgi:hypothetical protein
VIGDVVFKGRECLLERLDRSNFAVGEISAGLNGVLGVIVKPRTVTERRLHTHDRRTWVEFGRALVEVEPWCAVTERAGQGIADGCFDRTFFGSKASSSLMHHARTLQR